MQTVKQQVLEINYAIHFPVKEEYLNIQESCQPETDTCAWIKQETLNKQPSYSVNRIKQESHDNCTDCSVDCNSDSKLSVIFNAGIDNFGCHSNETDMGIAKSRRTSHHSVDIIETNLEYNPSNMIKPSLSPAALSSDDNADSTVKYSFGPVKNETMESRDYRIYGVDVTEDWESSVGDLLTPIRSKVSSAAGGSSAKKLNLSGVKKAGRPPVSSKIPSVKKTGRPSKGKLTPKKTPRSSLRKTTDNTSKGKVASRRVKAKKSVGKVLETSERKPKVLLKRSSSLISPRGKVNAETRLKRKVSNKRPVGSVLAYHKLSPGQDLICRWCGLQCTTLQALSRHSLQHQEAKTFYCSLCAFPCQYLWQLHSHRSVAHPELVSPAAQRTGRTFRCQACQYTCKNIGMLKRHMLIHLQLRQYACKVCPYTCNIKYNLKLHMLRHNRVKPHKCKVCGMRFTRSPTLTAHSRVHTGEKPYSCESCNFTCAHFSSLRRHRVQHKTNNERMCCPTCDFACKLLVTFLKHRATEHNERGLYSCHLCHARLDNTRQLAKHLRTHKKEGKYGDDEELFRLPKYLVRIRDKKLIKQVETQQKDAKNVLEATRRVLKDSSNTSIGKLIIKNLGKGNKAIKKIGRPPKAAKIVSKSSPIVKSIKNIPDKVPTDYSEVPEFVTGTGVVNVPPSLLQVKVMCRRLTISEIIRRRVNNNL